MQTVAATMGCDPHLDTVAVAVVDGAGLKVLDERVVANTPTGHGEVAALCRSLGVSQVGIEGASGYGRALAETLHTAGMDVWEVPTRATVTERRRQGGSKSDPIDARAIARAVVAGNVHRWSNDTDLESLRRLVNRRETLVKQQTQTINNLRALLAEIDPQLAATLGRIRSQRILKRLIDTDYATADTTTVWLIADLAQDCLHRHQRIKELTTKIHHALPPAGIALMTIPGCGPITAAWILAQVAGTDHFATEAHFAMYTGAAPLDASSGRQQHHRLNRGGNRQLNRALHTIIITQHNTRGEAHHYIQRRKTEGLTHRQAIRACKRHLARRIWKILNHHGLTPTLT